MRINIECTERASCDNNTCNVNVTAMIQWNHNWVIGLYIVELMILLAVLLCIVYLIRNRNSPLLQSCFSFDDYIILAILSIFCILPLVHIGNFSAERCFIMWSMLNVIYAFYTALLMTKTVFLQNLLGCQAPTDNCGRRVLFAVFILVLHVIILATLSITGLPTVNRFVCSTRGVIMLCDLRGNLNIIFSTAFNWFVIFFLFVLTLVEAVNNSNDPKRTKNQFGMSFSLFLSFTCLVISIYFKLQLQYYTLVTFLFYVIYLINPVISLVSYYFPNIYLIYTCLRKQEIFQKNAQKMSASRLKVPTDNVLFNQSQRTSFDPGRTPSWSQASEASSLSYPSSLVYPDGEFIRVVSDLRKSLDHTIFGGSLPSFHGNVVRDDDHFSSEGSLAGKQFSENNEDMEFTAEELIEMLTFVQNLESTDV